MILSHGKPTANLYKIIDIKSTPPILGLFRAILVFFALFSVFEIFRAKMPKMVKNIKFIHFDRFIAKIRFFDLFGQKLSKSCKTAKNDKNTPKSIKKGGVLFYSIFENLSLIDVYQEKKACF